MNKKDPFAESFQVALYKSLTGGLTYVSEFYGERDVKLHYDTVRISEPLSITLKPLSDREAITNAIAVLDAKEKKLMADTEMGLREIREQKQSLLAIAHDKTEAA